MEASLSVKDALVEISQSPSRTQTLDTYLALHGSEIRVMTIPARYLRLISSRPRYNSGGSKSTP